MGLVVNFNTIQSSTILVTYFQIREYSPDYRHRASLIFYYRYQYCFYVLLLLIASQLSNLIIKYHRQSSNLSFLNSLTQLSLLYLRGIKCIDSIVSQFIYVVNELIIIDWEFMHELNILSPLSLARFLSTQQLIYKRKIEKHKISLDIFVSDTTVVQPAQLLQPEMTLF